MPTREMRGRYLLREFWSDVELQTALDAEERWFLVGLWMLADDGGWLEWNPVYIGQQLYQYEDRAKREQDAAEHLETILALGKAKRYSCGHVFLPAAAVYKRPGRSSEASFEVERAHLSEAKRKRPGMNGKYSGGITPPKPIPNPTHTRPSRASAAARGGPPRSLKDLVGWEPT
jgi:hypothetical protein